VRNLNTAPRHNSVLGRRMSIRLFYRHEISTEEQLQIGETSTVPEFLIGHISGETNPGPGYVASRLRAMRMPYERLYLPVFVFEGALPEALSDVHTGVWGPGFYLNPDTVIPDLEIVCRWDIQNAATNNKPRDWFKDLRGMTVADKTRCLREAARRTPSYAEARMFRVLRAEDFL
jgi:hypothetical protein